MKRLLLSGVIALLWSNAPAIQPDRGYRGFAEWSNDITTYEGLEPGNSVTYFYTGLSTSHGYQFNPNLFVGAGVAVEYNNRSESFVVPAFVQVRTDQKFGWFTPFGDLRAGYSLTDGGGLYFSPTIGYRFNWGRKSGLNIGLGLTVKGNKVDIYNADPVQSPDGYLVYVKTGSKRFTKAMFAFRIGFDF